MTTGIREFCNQKFAEYLPKRAELGNTEFRKSVMADTILEFHITLASAATHYNHSLKAARAANPAAVADLGRDPSKKGGRKPIHTVDVIKVKTGEIVATGLSKAAADELIALAALKKKAKLAIKEVVAEPVVDTSLITTAVEPTVADTATVAAPATEAVTA
jgi:hypothetical protein